MDTAIAVAGIVGTLLGTVVGGVSAWLIQRQQLAHAERVRFHDKRLAEYANFARQSQALVNAVRDRTPLNLAAYETAQELVLLLGRARLLQDVLKVQEGIRLVRRASDEPDEKNAAIESYNAARQGFLLTAREELGIPP